MDKKNKSKSKSKKTKAKKKDIANREVLSIRLRPSDIKMLDAVATLKDATRTSIIERLICDYLKSYNAKPKKINKPNKPKTIGAS